MGAGVEQQPPENEATTGSCSHIEHDPVSVDVPVGESLEGTGLHGLIKAVRRYTAEAQGDSRAVIRRLGEDFAYIRLQDVKQPLRFLRQMAGSPPIRLGLGGFRQDLIDDHDPARHYIAFVVVGFWVPRPLADLVLWLWEILGFIRYRGHWSRPDLDSGFVGIRHGRQVRRAGIEVLPDLLIRDVAESPEAFRSA
jgi:hypothetical protein